MKKLVNEPGNVVPEMLIGLSFTQKNVQLMKEYGVIVRKDIDQIKDSQVTLVSGGGSGHEPSHAGFVGQGMLSAAVCGDVFCSPSWAQIYAAIKVVAGKMGVLLIVKNYMGDIINFTIASQFAQKEGIKCEIIVVGDDVALLDRVDKKKARGLAGTVFIHKLAGALGEQGKSLQEIVESLRPVVEEIKTMGIALSPCTIPSVGTSSFTLGPNEFGFGQGIHGEAGHHTKCDIKSDAIVDELLDTILSHVTFTSKKSVILLLNNLGTTTNMEMSIVCSRIVAFLQEKDISISSLYCGPLMTSLEMAGISISVLPVLDSLNLCDLLDHPTEVAAWPKALYLNNDNLRPSPEMPSILQKSNSTPSERKEGRLVNGIKHVCQYLIKSTDLLTELDQKLADGDMGVNLAKACQFILEEIDTYPDSNNPNVIFSNLAFSMRHFDSFRNEEESIETWSKALLNGTDAISHLGGATEGQKTMLDALYPMCRSLEQNKETDIKQIISSILAAAEEGSSNTQNMQSRAGRSAYQGDKSVGILDPGAIYWVVGALKIGRRDI